MSTTHVTIHVTKTTKSDAQYFRNHAPDTDFFGVDVQHGEATFSFLGQPDDLERVFATALARLHVAKAQADPRTDTLNAQRARRLDELTSIRTPVELARDDELDTAPDEVGPYRCPRCDGWTSRLEGPCGACERIAASA